MQNINAEKLDCFSMFKRLLSKKKIFDQKVYYNKLISEDLLDDLTKAFWNNYDKNKYTKSFAPRTLFQFLRRRNRSFIYLYTI